MSIHSISIRRAGSTVALDAAQKAEISAQVVGGILRGSSRIVAANSYVEGGEITFGVGGWPLAALPIMMGVAAISPSGSTPNRVATLNVPASSALPYFEVAARADDGSGGNVLIYAAKCKLMSGFPFQVQDGANFVTPEITAQLVPDDSGYPFKLIYNETAALVSTAFPAAATKSVSALAITDGIATATSAGHGFTAGQWVTISGITDVSATYANGLKQIIHVEDANTFSYAAIGAADDASVSGTIIASY